MYQEIDCESKMDVREQLKESEVTEVSKKLKSFGLVIDEVKFGRRTIKDIDSIVATVEGWLQNENLNTFDRLMSFYVLGQAYNAKKCLTVDPSRAMFNNSLVLKEIFCYRKTLNIAEEIKERGLWVLYKTVLGCVYQANVHLGNVYDHLGRHQDAQYSYLLAAQMMPSDYMWKFNVGFSLGGMFGYYENRVKPFVVEQAKELLKPYLDRPETTSSAKQMWEKLSPLKTLPLSEDKEYEYADTDEDKYAQWVNDHFLRLNAYNDVHPYSLLSQDDSLYFESLFYKRERFEDSQRLMALLNEIKQEYVSARYMLYSYFVNSGTIHFSDSNVRIADVYDLCNYSYNIELAKAAFRALYSLLDKIAFALNDYLGLGVKGKDVSFSTFWYNERKKRILRQEILGHLTVISLAGLLFIRNDIYGGDESYLQADETKLLQKVRNAMEHRAIQIVDKGIFEDKGSVLFISRKEFEKVSMNLIRTVRQAIFCFVNAVSHISYNQAEEAKKHGVVMEQFFDEVKDEDKV